MMIQNKERDTRVLVAARYNQAQDLEGRIQKLRSSGTDASAASIRELRNTLSTKYQDIILEDGAYAEEKNVENLLWRLYYSQIEEFRSRIRKYTTTPHTGPTALEGAAKAEQAARREHLRKIIVSFRSFLSEASSFYHDLMRKLKARQGLPPDYSFATAEFDNSYPLKAAELIRCAMLCQRCCICLGDFARYKELHTNGNAGSRDWTVATGYYLQAAGIWPGGGNPHNQLAVLSTYSDDEVVAVYRYFRSLAVDVPFLTARDNLILQFEKNRHRYTQLPPALSSLPAAAATEAGGRTASRGSSASQGDRVVTTAQADVKLAVKGRARGSQTKEVRDADDAQIAARRKSFRIRFVRLVGIIFTKTSLETFEDAQSGAMTDLDALLALGNERLEAGLGIKPSAGNGEPGPENLLQIAAILIFTIENVSWVPEKHQPSYAEISKSSELRQMGNAAAFEVMGRLMRRCKEADDITKSPLLSALLLFLEWLLHSPEAWKSADSRGEQEASKVFFWRQTVGLLNAIADAIVPGDRSQDSYSGNFVNGSRPVVAWMHILDQPPRAGEKRGAIWEDFELRGFLPLAPAHKLLTFSRGTTGIREADESRERVSRILWAGRSLAEHKVLKELKQEAVSGRFYRPGDPLPALIQQAPPVPGAKVYQAGSGQEAIQRGPLLQHHPDTIDHGLIPWPGLPRNQTEAEHVVSYQDLEPKVGASVTCMRHDGIASNVVENGGGVVRLIDALGTELGERPGYQLQGAQLGVETLDGEWLDEAGELENDEEDGEEDGAQPEWMAPGIEEIEKEVGQNGKLEKRQQERQAELEAMRLVNHRESGQVSGWKETYYPEPAKDWLAPHVLQQPPPLLGNTVGVPTISGVLGGPEGEEEEVILFRPPSRDGGERLSVPGGMNGVPHPAPGVAVVPKRDGVFSVSASASPQPSLAAMALGTTLLHSRFASPQAPNMPIWAGEVDPTHGYVNGSNRVPFVDEIQSTPSPQRNSAAYIDPLQVFPGGGEARRVGIHAPESHVRALPVTAGDGGGVRSDAYKMGAGGLDWATLNSLLGYQGGAVGSNGAPAAPPSGTEITRPRPSQPVKGSQYPTLGELASMYNVGPGGGMGGLQPSWALAGHVGGGLDTHQADGLLKSNGHMAGLDPLRDAGVGGSLLGLVSMETHKGLWGFGSSSAGGPQSTVSPRLPTRRESEFAPLDGQSWIEGVGPPQEYGWLDAHSHIKPADPLAGSWGPRLGQDLGTSLWGVGEPAAWDPAENPSFGGGGWGAQGWVTSPGRAPGSLLAFDHVLDGGERTEGHRSENRGGGSREGEVGQERSLSGVAEVP